MSKLTELYEAVKQNKGLTLDRDLNVYDGAGYAVALPENEYTVAVHSFSFETFQAIINYYQHDVMNEVPQARYIGIWVDGDKVYFDATDVIEDRSIAEKLGKKFNQLAIYDFSNKQSITL